MPKLNARKSVTSTAAFNAVRNLARNGKPVSSRAVQRALGGERLSQFELQSLT